MSDKLKIVFAGTPEIARTVLENILANNLISVIKIVSKSNNTNALNLVKRH